MKDDKSKVREKADHNNPKSSAIKKANDPHLSKLNEKAAKEAEHEKNAAEKK